MPDAVAPRALEPAVARPDGPAHWLVDLVVANRQQLVAGGVRSDRIVECGATTADEPFFSDRRNGPAADSPCWPASSTEAGPRPVAP